MHLARLSNAHSQQAVDLILPIQRGEFGVPITVQDQPDLLDIDNFYNKPGGAFWGAFDMAAPANSDPALDSEAAPGDQAELIGTIALINAGHATGVIRKMFVKKEYRGKQPKAAQLLIEELIAFCRQKGLTDLYLGSVDQMKAAHRFYERNGFRQIDPNDLPVHFPRMALDTVFYHLTLAQ